MRLFKLALRVEPKSTPNQKNVWLWTEAKNLRRSTRPRGLKEKREFLEWHLGLVEGPGVYRVN
jgi:hypothetical protein